MAHEEDWRRIRSMPAAQTAEIMDINRRSVVSRLYCAACGAEGRETEHAGFSEYAVFMRMETRKCRLLRVTDEKTAFAVPHEKRNID